MSVIVGDQSYSNTYTIDQQALEANKEAVQELADLYYLSMNTGVDGAKYNAALEKLGVDTTNEGYAGASTFIGEDILRAAGYTPGVVENFYGNNQAIDAGAQILKDKWSEYDKAKANLKPGQTMENSNVANSIYLEQELNKRGITDTAATMPSAYGYTIDDMPSGDLIFDAQGNFTGQTTSSGLNTDDRINILEWDTSGTGATTPTTPTAPSAPSPVTPSVPAQELAQAQEVFTPKPDGGYNVTLPTGREGEKFKPPTITPPTLTGGSTTEEVSIPTYQTNFNRQASQFAQRATDEAQLLTPQTLAEKQAAGVAGNIQSRLFQNNQGMSMYISGILNQDGQFIPQQPVPQGYFDTTQKQQAIQANQGVLVSGYQSGGYVTFSRVDDRSQPDAPSFVPIMSDGSELASFPTSEEASTAGKDQEAANKKAYDDSRININQPQDLTTTQIGPEDVYDAQKSVVAQATVAPAGAVTAPPVSYIDPNTTGAVLPSTTGLALGTAPTVDQPAQVQQVTQAKDPSASVDGVKPAAATAETVSKTDFTKAGDSIGTELAKLSAQTKTTPTKEITEATQDTTKVSDLSAAQGTATKVEDAPTRTLQQGELISGSAVDQARVEGVFGTGEVQAASAVDEMATLMRDFEGGNTPIWARGAMQRATEVMAQRGLSASSLAGQAIVHAAMEASIPLAKLEAGNKQQMAIEKAKQRASFLQQEFDQEFETKVRNTATISAIANINFSADQQIAIENARLAQTMDLANLGNRQALIIAEAAQIAQLELASLSNQQQAQVQNAQNFLALDMANLNNEQATEIFKAQARNNVLLSDTAAENSRLQFNAATENQVNQFMATLTSQVSQFNSAQTNAMKQFNANEANALLKFNSELQNQRELFNAQQRAVIAQANALWRQNTTTANTAAANQSNFEYAKQVNGLTNKVIDQIWQRERDLMSFSMAESESALDRALKIILADKDLEAVREQLDAQEARDKGSFFARFLFGSSLSGFPGLFNLG